MRRLEGIVGGRGIGKTGLLIVAVVALVALAGCSGLTGGDGGATPTESGPPAAATIVNETASTMEDVDGYRMDAVWNSTISSPNGERKSNATVTTSIDREADRIEVEQTVEALGRSITAQMYLVDGTVYRHNPQLAQQYDSEWVTVDASGNLSRLFHQNDELMGHRAMLENATVTLNGTETVDGTEAYRLELDVNETAMEVFYGYDDTPLNITELSTTVWVDTETNRMVRADGVMTQQTTVAGQTATTSIDYDERFAYVDVSITLPEEADSAVSIGQ